MIMHIVSEETQIIKIIRNRKRVYFTVCKLYLNIQNKIKIYEKYSNFWLILEIWCKITTRKKTKQNTSHLPNWPKIKNPNKIKFWQRHEATRISIYMLLVGTQVSTILESNSILISQVKDDTTIPLLFYTLRNSYKWASGKQVCSMNVGLNKIAKMWRQHNPLMVKWSNRLWKSNTGNYTPVDKTKN